MAETMFERYGGFAKISRIVSAFYDKVLDSPIMAPYFENTDMKRLVDHQTKFIASLMGGPASYSNQQLERLHAHLNIDQEALDEMILLLTETLEDFDLDDSDIDLVRQDLESRSKFIITRG